MSDQNEQADDQPRLYPEDQAKVDAFITSGVNSVERKPFKPLRLLVLLMVVVIGFSLMSQLIAKWAGIY
jgi:AmiR/NasT family two-component response regulator|tara:strand:- start:33081 stop:33287 length:207 start_codon:yes stop_codon:yes gene_type:complete